MKMKMQEFIDKYCEDIKSLCKNRASLLDDFDLPYDDVEEDDSGQPVKVVYCGQYTIPILDIITTTKEDFARNYPDFACRELYDNYVSSLIMLEGEDAVNHIRNVIQHEQERVLAFAQDNTLADMV